MLAALAPALGAGAVARLGGVDLGTAPARAQEQHEHGGARRRATRTGTARCPTTRASRPAGASTTPRTASTPPSCCATSTTARTRRLASGRTLREWELVAVDKEVEVAPGREVPGLDLQRPHPGARRCAPARASGCGSGSATAPSIRTRSTSTASTRPAMDGLPGRRARDHRARASRSPTSSTPSRSACTSTTATSRRWPSTSRAACTARSSSTRARAARRPTSW